MMGRETISSEEFNKAYKKALLHTFKRTIDFLESHHVKWCVCGGTCLGAARHHDMIPWDDDIDIFIPRNDYERLFTIREDLSRYQLDMKSIEDGRGCCYGFVKIFDTNTTLWELKNLPCLFGVYIDVFPVERSDISRDEFTNVQRKYQRARKLYQNRISSVGVKDLTRWLFGLHLRMIWDKFSSRIKSFGKVYSNFLESTRQIEYNAHGKYIMCVMGSYYERDYYPSEWFANTIEMPFSDFVVKMPVGYNQYLRQLYGDYMTLPPIEEQVSHHCHYYCNLRERLSMTEVMERIKQNEFTVI